MYTHPILGDLPANTFLSEYWQRKPLLLRSTTQDFTLPLNGDELAGLSLEPDVEARLVQGNGQSQTPYRLTHGPFTEQDFARLPEQDWTLLVQAVDLWAPEFRTLLDRFDFLPPWRLDDIMASYAVTGGSVGPHFDLYDVFLVQAQGQRRWRIGQVCDSETPLQAHEDLSLLAQFEVQEEWLLNPGDVLYIPPHVAHWGIAETPGITLSVGFRAPTPADLMDDLAVEVAAQKGSVPMPDPPLDRSMATPELHPAYVAQVQQMLGELINDERMLGEWLARFMTRPKYADLTELTDERRRATYAGVQYENGEPQHESEKDA